MSVTNFRRASLRGGLPKSSDFADIAPAGPIEPVLTNLIYLLDASSTVSYPGSGTTWFDISGNGKNATLVNGTSYSTAGGAPSMIFDGINDYVTFGAGNVAQPSLPVTFNFWVKTIGTAPNQPNGMFDVAPGQANLFRQINRTAHGAAANPSVEWSNQNPVIEITQTAGSYTATNWNQYTFVFNFSTNRIVKWYQNGVFITTATGNTSTSLSWTEVVLGAINKNDYWLNAYMNNAALYNIELTAGQILQNYNAYKGRFGL